jgi:magnesium chelatase family protein
MAMMARDLKIPNVLLPNGNAREAAVVDGISVFPMGTLTEVVDFLNGNRQVDALRLDPVCAATESHYRLEDSAMFEDSITPNALSKSPWPAGTTC